MSASSTVPSEIAKGTLAHNLERAGQLEELVAAKAERPVVGGAAQGLLNQLADLHPSAVRNMIESGGNRFWSELDPSQKVTNYYYTKMGQNQFWPVSDAHFARMVGLPDVRPWKPVASDEGTVLAPNEASIGKTEMAPVGEWFHRNVAEPLGLTGGGTGQPLLWGAGASRTGVESEIGAPYVEMVANAAAKAGARQGISPLDAWIRYMLASGDPYKTYLGSLLAAGVVLPGIDELVSGSDDKKND